MKVTREEARESLIHGTNNKYHLCEVLRLTYDYVHEMPEGEAKTKMTTLLIDAMMMAKKMNNRLHYYHNAYGDNSGSEGRNFIGLTGVRARAAMRKARP